MVNMVLCTKGINGTFGGNIENATCRKDCIFHLKVPEP